MASAGRGCGGPEKEAPPPPPPPVLYHMSDDEEDKAFYARADRPRTPTSPGYMRYNYRPDDIGTAAADDMVDYDGDDMVDDDDADADADEMADNAAGYSSSESDDEAASPERMYEDDPPDPVGARRQAERYAGYALQHYNADPSNAVKYELVEATESSYIFVGYAHVNFVARPRGAGAGRERLFFAEVHRQLERDTMVPTCLRSLDSEDDRVGGLAGEPWEDHAGPDEARYCFACHDALKHPKDGTCYKAGH